MVLIHASTGHVRRDYHLTGLCTFLPRVLEREVQLAINVQRPRDTW